MVADAAQDAVVRAIRDERVNVAAIGPAGAGKSRLIERVKNGDDGVVVVATTGVAASNVGGLTIHDWLGPLARRIDEPPAIRASSAAAREQWLSERLEQVRDALRAYNLPRLLASEFAVSKAGRRAPAWKRRLAARLVQPHTVVIDEVSMMNERLLRLVDTSLRAANRSSVSFGGKVMLLVGDFGQLPSVEPWHRPLFESSLWSHFRPHLLLRSHRHSDAATVRACMEVWLGRASASTLSALRGLEGPASRGAAAAKTCKIFPLRRLVAAENTTAESERVGESTGGRSYIARVAFEKGEDDGLVGEPGHRAFDTWRSPAFVVPDVEAQRAVERLLQRVPRKVELSPGSRVAMRCNRHRADTGVANGTQGVVVRVEEEGVTVRFDNGATLDVSDHVWMDRYNGGVVGVKQLPLALAHAVTVHASQGCTLDAVEIHCAKMWEAGHFYTALSRCRSLEGVRLVGFDESVVRADPAFVRYVTRLMTPPKRKRV